MGVGYRWGRIFQNPLEPALALGPPGLVKARSADAFLRSEGTSEAPACPGGARKLVSRAAGQATAGEQAAAGLGRLVRWGPWWCLPAPC